MELSHKPCADPESFGKGGPTLTGFLGGGFVDEGREDQNTTKRGPVSARQQNGVSLASQ